jgi:hypothetical protein
MFPAGKGRQPFEPGQLALESERRSLVHRPPQALDTALERLGPGHPVPNNRPGEELARQVTVLLRDDGDQAAQKEPGDHLGRVPLPLQPPRDRAHLRKRASRRRGWARGERGWVEEDGP